MERNYKLYVHIAPNGKKYYGITCQEVNKRWGKGSQYKNNQHFTNAVKKYGWDNIEHIVIYDDLTENEAKELEQYMIQWYNTANRDYGYNISLGGDGVKGMYGEKNSFYGKHHTEENKQLYRENNSGANHVASKSVICVTTNKVFGSTREAARYYGISSNSSICACCKGQKKSAGKSPNNEKLVWKYIDIIEL